MRAQLAEELLARHQHQLLIGAGAQTDGQGLRHHMREIMPVELLRLLPRADAVARRAGAFEAAAGTLALMLGEMRLLGAPAIHRLPAVAVPVGTDDAGALPVGDKDPALAMGGHVGLVAKGVKR